MDRSEKLFQALLLLQDCARQFRFYEANHRAKNTEDGLAKAEVNAQMATTIEEFLNAT